MPWATSVLAHLPVMPWHCHRVVLSLRAPSRPPAPVALRRVGRLTTLVSCRQEQAARSAMGPKSNSSMDRAVALVCEAAFKHDLHTHNPLDLERRVRSHSPVLPPFMTGGQRPHAESGLRCRAGARADARPEVLPEPAPAKEDGAQEVRAGGDDGAADGADMKPAAASKTSATTPPRCADASRHAPARAANVRRRALGVDGGRQQRRPRLAACGSGAARRSPGADMEVHINVTARDGTAI